MVTAPFVVITTIAMRESGVRRRKGTLGSSQVFEQTAEGAASGQQIFFWHARFETKDDRLGDGHQLLAQGLALARECDDACAGVLRVDRARHEPALFHAVEDAGHGGLVAQRALAQFGDRASITLPEPRQYDPLFGRELEPMLVELTIGDPADAL